MFKMKFTAFICSTLMVIAACGQTPNSETKDGSSRKFAVQKSPEEWKEQLSELEYEVLRNDGTEMAFTGKYVDWKKEGTYVCRACGNPLFSSETKFKSGTGWPSFWDFLNEESILKVPDYSYGVKQTEVECQRCGSHLGHVFKDGPEPTGLRYCINSVSLDFEEK